MQTQIMKIEYDTTNIDIDSLCTKYGVTKESLDWYQQEEPIQTEILPAKFDKAQSVEEVKATLILQTVDDVKEKAINWAKNLLDTADDELTTKEVKDLIHIADTVEASYKPKQTDGPAQVNILVQNLMAAKDDC